MYIRNYIISSCLYFKEVEKMNKKYLPIILFAVIVSFAIFAFTPIGVGLEEVNVR